MKNHLILGQWNALCDICGFKFKSSQLKKNWKGQMVCEQDWEPRHMSDLIRIQPEAGGTEWARPEGDDEFVPVCYIWDSSAYAGLAEAGCMIAGRTGGFTGTQLATLKAGT